MKKLLIGLGCIVVLFVAAVYVFIPSNIRLQASTVIAAPVNGVLRPIVNQSSWKAWWPGQLSDSGYTLNGNRFFLKGVQLNGLLIGILSGSDTALTRLDLLHEKPDTLDLSWRAAVNAGINPVTRIQRYLESRGLQRSMQTVLDSLRDFYHVQSNMYDLHINDQALFDSVLIFTETRSKFPPSTMIVYSLIDELNQYILHQKARAANQPMMNWEKLPDQEYVIRVAIPVDRELPPSGRIVPKLMPPRVRILTADVRGDQHAADEGLKRMDLFALDHFLKPPGTPFFSLRTDRRAEADSTKWITRIVYPVM